MKKAIVLIISVLMTTVLFAQTPDNAAIFDTAKLYIKAGKTDQGIKMLEGLVKSDNQNFNYAYVLSDTYVKAGKPKKAISLLEKFTEQKTFPESAWSMLGTAYRLNGDNEKAKETFKTGLQRYPKSGMMFRDLGMTEMFEKKFQNAIKYWDMGINTQPAYDDNYYCEAKLFANSPNKLWAIFYGEIYLNIAKDSAKILEMNKILFDVYSKNIIIKPDFFTVDLVAETNVNVPVTTEKIRLPFTLVYQKLMLKSVDPLFKNQQTQISLENIAKIRNNMLENIISTKMNEEYPNIVFNNYIELGKSKLFECYTYWLMGNGSPQEFADWKEKNAEKWAEFLEYIGNSYMSVDDENKFMRMQ